MTKIFNLHFSKVTSVTPSWIILDSHTVVCLHYSTPPHQGIPGHHAYFPIFFHLRLQPVQIGLSLSNGKKNICKIWKKFKLVCPYPIAVWDRHLRLLCIFHLVEFQPQRVFNYKLFLIDYLESVFMISFAHVKIKPPNIRSLLWVFFYLKKLRK